MMELKLGQLDGKNWVTLNEFKTVQRILGEKTYGTNADVLDLIYVKNTILRLFRIITSIFGVLTVYFTVSLIVTGSVTESLKEIFLTPDSMIPFQLKWMAICVVILIIVSLFGWALRQKVEHDTSQYDVPT